MRIQAPSMLRPGLTLLAASLMLVQIPARAQTDAAAPVADEGLATIPVQTTGEATPEPASSGAGRHLLQVGVFHINNLDKSRELHSSIKPGALAALGVDAEFTSAGTGARVSSEQTLALIYSYFITDNIAIKFEGGIPARFSIQGEGIVQPTGPLGATVAVDLASPANNPLAKVTQWSPVVLAQYVFRSPDKALRPYLGVGMTYTWFKKVRANQNFVDELNSKFGATLSAGNLKVGDTTVDAAASDDLAPVFNAGLSYDITPKWSLASSISYSLLKTTANITIDAADGERLSTSRTKLELNPLVMSLLVGYRFNL